MGSKKSKVLIIVSVVLFVLAIAGFVFSGIIKAVASLTGPILLVALIFITIGCFLLASGIGLYTKSKYTNIKMNDASSLYYQTYGKGKKFERFDAQVKIKKQQVVNTITNVIGSLSFTFLGVGVFSAGGNDLDVFVSEDEIIFNNERKNRTYNDNQFVRINAGYINRIEFKSRYNYVAIERVTIIPCEGRTITLDIFAKQETEKERIRKVFKTFNKQELAFNEIEKTV